MNTILNGRVRRCETTRGIVENRKSGKHEKEEKCGARAVDREGWVSLLSGLELKAASTQSNAPITSHVNQFWGNSPPR